MKEKHIKTGSLTLAGGLVGGAGVIEIISVLFVYIFLVNFIIPINV